MKMPFKSSLGLLALVVGAFLFVVQGEALADGGAVRLVAAVFGLVLMGLGLVLNRRSRPEPAIERYSDHIDDHIDYDDPEEWPLPESAHTGKPTGHVRKEVAEDAIHVVTGFLDLKVFNHVPYKNGQFDPATAPEVERTAPIYNAIAGGDQAARKDFPQRLYWSGKCAYPGPLKPLSVLAGRFLILRADIAAIFRQHDLGDAALLPVTLLDGDQTTLIAQDALVLVPGTFRRTVDHASPHLSKNRYARPPRFSLLDEPDQLAQVKLLPQANDGLALWWDDTIQHALFLRGHLVRELSRSGLDNERGVRLLGDHSE
jgi:hypothetical protein